MEENSFKIEVVKIEKIEKHPNADRLDIATVFNYPVIVKRGEFKLGDLAIYFPIDSLLPNEPKYSFVWRDKEKPSEKSRVVRAMKLRGVFSMGLLMPTNSLSVVGQDLSEILGITEWQEPEKYDTSGTNIKGPPWFFKYTHLRQLRQYACELEEGETLAITEKIHGCLYNNQRIRMADGSTKIITKIKIGDMVLGVNKDSTVIETPVTKTFNNGKANQWIEVKTKRANVGKGNSFTRIIATPNHKFYDPITKKYRALKEFTEKDKIVTIRNDRRPKPFIAEVVSEFKQDIIEQDIISIIDVTDKIKSFKYDIETGTHNFFCPDVLVHNSNARFCFHENQLWVGSRNLVKDPEDNSLWSSIAKNLQLENKLSKFPDKIIFGEIYGSNLQKGFPYNTPHKYSFRAFDIFNIQTDKYLDFWPFVKVCAELDIHIVPILGSLKWENIIKIEPYCKGNTVLGEKHIREGVVIRPDKERANRKGNRVIFKLKSERFLLEH